MEQEVRIVIDYQGAQNSSRHRGIGRYTTSLVDALIKNNVKHEIIILLSNLFHETVDSIRQHFANLDPTVKVVIWKAIAPAALLDDALKDKRRIAECMREATINQLKPDLVLITSLLDCLHDSTVSGIRDDSTYATALIFYDAIPLLQQEIYLKPNPHFEKVYLSKIREISNAAILFAISESARQEAITHLKYPDGQSFNIGAGVSFFFQKMDIAEGVKKQVLEKFGINKPFIMYSGASDERKNHAGLIQAFARLKSEGFNGFQLALVGGLPEENRKKFRDIASNFNLTEKEVIITGQVSDEELIALYNLCDLFVFPSLHEGFGLPALEAMSCGAPVIGSDSTSIPEILANPDLLFDPSSAKNIANAIKRILSDEVYRAQVADYCLFQSRNFSWDLSAKALLRGLDIYAEDIKRNVVHESAPNEQVRLFNGIIESIARLSEPEKLIINGYLSEFNLKKNKLFVDVSELIHRDARSGIQRVVKNIYQVFCMTDLVDYDVVPVYALNDGRGYFVSSKFNKNFFHDEIVYPIVSESDQLVTFSDGDVFLGLDLQPEIVPTYQDFYQGMRNQGVRIYFVVYDILSLTMPEHFPEGAEANFGKWFSTVVESSDGLICISQNVARECQDWIASHEFTRKPESVDWWNLGADFVSSKASNSVDSKNVIFTLQLSKLKDQMNFLMVGTLEPRKGHEQILEAFEALWAKGVMANLIIVGKVGWNTDNLVKKIINHEMLNKKLFWFNAPSDAELENLYLESTSLIAGSYGEGYGLPIVEAAKRGLPIICRNIPVFREVAGEASFYLKGASSLEIADDIYQWIGLYREGLFKNPSNINFLSWKESAQLLIQKIGLFTKNHQITDSVISSL
jgi:glycosyltransferase involved in cell wall biosynthesis